MKPVAAEIMRFIRLGENEEFKDESLKKGLIKIGFKNTDHELCLNGKWEEIRKNYMAQYNNDKNYKGTVTIWINQLKMFYLDDDETMWVTVIDGIVWWCFSYQEITLNSDKTKTRTVFGKWHNTDIQGRILDANLIDDTLVKPKRYRGTIRNIEDKERDQILSIINCEQ